ncbi:hypothetical protein CMO93_03530 [Candidatus Woesearchaeota archaeon]|nr:hypothetical protein [Candidatus Woesearchaeota archaeon]|tara:strand:- start:1107 stop:1562 length:456 start_codon:yes stop_codon:yes gene_type:complete
MKKSNLFNKLLGSLFIAFILGVFFGYFLIPEKKHEMNMEEMRNSFISLKNSIQKENLQNHKYRCCLEKPCVYCIEKTPGHGEGSICDCLSDIINGVHPCGECIGEILEGHGNPYLAEYFAKAIAEKVGEEHLDTLKEIISEKYDIAIEDQL